MDICSPTGAQVESAGRDAEGAGRRHHRLRQGHPQGRARRRRGAGRDRGPHPERPALLPGTDVIVDVGGQDIKLIILKNGRSRTSSSTRSARRATATSCSPPPGLRLRRGGLRRRRLQRQGDAGVRLRLRGVHAVGHRRLPAPGLAARDHGRPGAVLPKNIWLYVCPDPQPGQARAASCCRAARSTTWRRSRARWTSSARASGKGRSRGDRPQALRRIRRHRLRPRGPRLWRDEQGHRPASSAWSAVRQIRLPHDAQRGHALLLLQEQVPAHLHRRQYNAPTPPVEADPRDSVPAEGSDGAKKCPVPLAGPSQRLIMATCDKGTVQDLRRCAASRPGWTTWCDAIRTSWRSPPAPYSSPRTSTPLPTGQSPRRGMGTVAPALGRAARCRHGARRQVRIGCRGC
jgi:hypothetical protein